MSWPIRLLIVVGVNDPAIEAQREVEKIEDVLRTVNRLVDVEVIEYPTINDLEEKCKCFRPHVFHYIGHGGSTKGKTHTFSCVAHNKTVRGLRSNRKHVADLGLGPRFAFLNACRSAAGQAALAGDVYVIQKT